VVFRDPADVLEEIAALYRAGVRNVRLGQQTCFFSYLNRDAAAIERLLAGIRDRCPGLEGPPGTATLSVRLDVQGVAASSAQVLYNC
jgi:hypothetical protein